jgi:hypothetical protein
VQSRKPKVHPAINAHPCMCARASDVVSSSALHAVLAIILRVDLFLAGEPKAKN